jgi:hypothetical protein
MPMFRYHRPKSLKTVKLRPRIHQVKIPKFKQKKLYIWKNSPNTHLNDRDIRSNRGH